MKHVVLIDPLEKLSIKKDSSLLLAIELKKKFETFIMFAAELTYETGEAVEANVWNFSGSVSDQFDVEEFQLEDSASIQWNNQVTLHMRLDPPVDGRYFRVLWILKAWEDQGVKIVNSASGILQHNEKMAAYILPGSLPTFVGGHFKSFKIFVESLDEEQVILKPLDLYQGLGIQLINKKSADLEQKFNKSVLDCGGAIVAQPFWSEIESGEIRSIWYVGKEIGNILKIPKSGSFLANIAQGAEVLPAELSLKTSEDCHKVSKQMRSQGIDWLAFDILGHSISEVNLTCPGLLVEVSRANKENLAEKIVNLMDV